MTNKEMYATGLTGVGAAKSIYGAWQTGEEYEANTLAYKRNSLLEIERNKSSLGIRENAKDAAEFGGAVALDAYMYTGGQKLDSIEGQLTDMNTQLLLQTSIAYEQSLAVDETVGNMMSRNAVDAMKSEARLVAGAAGTGTSGGTTRVATMEARSVEMFDNAVLIGRASSDKLNISRRLSMERLSSKNKRRNVASEISNVFGAQGAGAAYQEGYVKSYAAMPKSIKEGYIAHDIVQAEDTSTWLDSFFSYADILIDANLQDHFGDTNEPEVGDPKEKISLEKRGIEETTRGKRAGDTPVTLKGLGTLSLKEQAEWSDEDIAALSDASREKLFGRA